MKSPAMPGQLREPLRGIQLVAVCLTVESIEVLKHALHCGFDLGNVLLHKFVLQLQSAGD
jgi:hypothetical protein